MTNNQHQQPDAEPGKGVNLKAYYTPEEAAERWSVSVDTVRRGLKSGDIPYRKVGAQYRIPMEFVDSTQPTGD